MIFAFGILCYRKVNGKVDKSGKGLSEDSLFGKDSGRKFSYESQNSTFEHFEASGSIVGFIFTFKKLFVYRSDLIVPIVFCLKSFAFQVFVLDFL